MLSDSCSKVKIPLSGLQSHSAAQKNIPISRLSNVVAHPILAQKRPVPALTALSVAKKPDPSLEHRMSLGHETCPEQTLSSRFKIETLGAFRNLVPFTAFLSQVPIMCMNLRTLPVGLN